MPSAEFFLSIKTFSTVLHVLAAVCAMGAAFSADVLFHFFTADRKLSQAEARTLSILSRTVWYGLLAVTATGAAIFLSDPVGYLASAKFLAKMTIMVILVLNGVVLDRYVQTRLLGKGFFTGLQQAFARKVAFVCGTISVVSWISILALGVVDSVNSPYASILGLYAAILGTLITASLAVERFWFEPKRPQ
ncbi:MAG: hypothetical protein Q7R63_01315 [bacterium]|nr:hypothetical protein [bacterium]